MAVLEAERTRSVHKDTTAVISRGVEEAEPYTLDHFLAFMDEYRDLRIELTSEGELIIMPPAFSKTGMRNAKLTVRLGIWAEHDGTGTYFDSSTLFRLPNGAVRSPDASWVSKLRWQTLSEEEQEGIAPHCPDFVAEMRSKSDRLSTVQEKMREYMTCGAKLGWLIDPESGRVEIYRPDLEVKIVDNPTTLSGEAVLPRFVLELKGILE